MNRLKKVIACYCLTLTPTQADDLDWLKTWEVEFPETRSTDFFDSITGNNAVLLLGTEGAILHKTGENLAFSNAPAANASIKGQGFSIDSFYLFTDALYQSADGLQWTQQEDFLDSIEFDHFQATDLDGEPLFLAIKENYNVPVEVPGGIEYVFTPGGIKSSSDGVTWSDDSIEASWFPPFIATSDFRTQNWIKAIKIDGEIYSVFSVLKGGRLFQANFISVLRREEENRWAETGILRRETTAKPKYIYLPAEPDDLFEIGTLEVFPGELSTLFEISIPMYAINESGIVTKYEPETGWFSVITTQYEALKLTTVWMDKGRILANGIDGTLYEANPAALEPKWHPKHQYTEGGPKFQFVDVAFGNGLFVAVSMNGQLYGSLTGEQWFEIDSPLASSTLRFDVTRPPKLEFIGDRFILRDQYDRWAWSETGMNWQVFDEVGTGITRAKGNFIRSNSNRELGPQGISVSEDGKNWTLTLPILANPPLSNGEVVFTKTPLDNLQYRSIDGGISWVPTTEPDVRYSSLSGAFLRNYSNNQIEISKDGLHWESAPINPIPALDIYSPTETAFVENNWMAHDPLTGRLFVAQFGSSDWHELDFNRYSQLDEIAYGYGSLVRTGNSILEPNGNKSLLKSLENPTLESPSIFRFSSRAMTGPGENVQIAGFIVEGHESKRYLIRGLGPALEQFGIRDYTPNPRLLLYKSGHLIASNDDWEDQPNRDEISNTEQNLETFGLDEGSKDAALLLSLEPGIYTLSIVADHADTVAVTEIFDLDPQPNILTRVSQRCVVGEGEKTAIGQLNISGERPMRFIVRGLGPSLEGFGIVNALQDPYLEVFRGPDLLFTSEDPMWSEIDKNRALNIAHRLGMSKPYPNDATLFLSLTPGTYSFFLKSKSRGSGIGLLEVYQVPNEILEHSEP